MVHRIQKNLATCAAILLTFIVLQVAEGQNTSYTPLYTNADFTKSINVALPVGTTGASSDAANGAAAYNIPIAVPPGTNGVTPTLAIVYNSMGGNGLLGRGWSIGGLSAISRIGQSLYHNGTVKPVDLDADDRFALDGMRLQLKSGSYGANGATYGAELENFATITSNGDLGGGPLWFSVATKDGAIMEFGNTADARLLSSDGTKVLFWRINKLRYPDGNYIEFKYLLTDRDSRIDEINYTGNANTGLLPYNKLKFTYTVRSDVNTAFQGGSSMVSKYLLDKITITAEGAAAFKTYTFKYATNNNINSFLKEVVETGSNGANLNSTIFKYGDLPTALQTGSSSAVAGQQVDIFPGDVNGDGYSDIVACTRNVVNNIVYHTEFKVYQKSPSASSNTFSLTATVPLPANYIAFQPYNGSNHNQMSADFNGDAAQDIIFTKTTGSGSSREMQEVRVYTSPISGNTYGSPLVLTPYNNWKIVHPSGKYYLQGDFNGDGRTDILTMLGQSSSLYRTAIYYGGGSYWYDTGVTGTYFFNETDWPGVDRIDVVDFNGDGKDDVMLTKDDKCEIFTYGTLQLAERIYFSGFPTKWHQLFFGDFNGDGKTDILSRTSTTNNNAPWYKSISTGTGFVETPFTFGHTPDINEYYYGDKILIADYNGDGKMDISHSWNYSTTSKTDKYYSTGDGFYTEQYTNAHYFVSSPNIFVFDPSGDGRADIINRTYYGDPFDILYYHKEGKDLLLQKVKNGMDHTTEWTYKRLTEAGTFYTRGSLTNHPLNNVQPPVNLVYEMKSQNGIGGNTAVQYSYEEAKLHKEGKGFLGIKKTTANNLATGMKTVHELEFNTTFYASTPYRSSVYLASNNTLLHQTTYTNLFEEQGVGSKRVWIKVTSTGESIPFESRYAYSNNTFDAYGNVTQNVRSNNGVETVTTTTTYGTYGTPIPAKPTSITVSRSRSGAPAAYDVTSTYTYNTLGQLTGKTEFSGLPKSVATTYTYNSLGNQTGMTVTPAGMTPRSSATAYDSKGRFPLSVTNALGQTASATFDSRWGKPLSETGIDGLTVSYTYDAFGRRASTTMPMGFTISETYGWDINASEGTLHYQLSAYPGKPDVKIWYDLLDREKKKQVEGFQGQWITTKTTYDARNNVATTTAPYKTGETVLTTTNTYDVYNRLASTSNTLGTTTYAYAYNTSGQLTITKTNPAAQVSSKITDAADKIISATDYGGTLTYTYNSQGNLTEVKHGTTVVVTNEYDSYAKQTKLIDMNAGTTQYDYDALGQMTSQISALNQTTTTTYDLLGRMTQRSGPEGITAYDYFPSGSGASTNKIKKITGFSGDTEEFTYDAYGRMSTNKITVDGVAHISSFTYNIYGDITNTAYPSGFALNTAYDANGYLSTLKNGANTVTLFTNTGMNGFNQFTAYSLGNGTSATNTYYFGTPTRYATAGIQDLNLTWNYQSGNLTSRYDAIKGKTESFTYDNLNRLLSASGTGLQTLTTTYATNGNIGTKTDAGTYGYHANKKNAVVSVTNPGLNIPMLTQDISYTPYFQPATITENTYQLTYTYGHDQQRIKGVLQQNGTTLNTRYYFGGYEKDVTGSSTKHLHYINTGQGLVAIVVRENGVDNFYYVYTDHLGSILTVTNSAGAVIAEQNFDPWGRKRNPTTWTYSSIPSVPAWLYRGFTSHEYLPQFNLINMNGRMYDPVVGRMLSPDNNVQLADFTQNYNRYSYAFNNPLRYTDPNGEWIHIVIGAVVGGVINGIVHADRPGGFWKGFAIGAVAGAVTAATGGAVVGALGLASSGVVSGLVAGASGAVIGSPIQGIGNALVFGDPYSAQQWGKDILIGGAVGGVVGGAGAAIQNARGNPTNIWWGRAPANGRGIWSFSNKPKFETIVARPGYSIEIGELNGEFPNYNTLEFDGGSKIVNGELVPYYPPNGGAAGSWVEETLQPGMILDRYGSNAGMYLSPEGTPFPMRALPPATNTANYHVFEVTKPLPILKSAVAPWFGQPGGGIQYFTNGISIDYLIEFGFLRQIK